jgi:hypothetical protein
MALQYLTTVMTVAPALSGLFCFSAAVTAMADFLTMVTVAVAAAS